MLEELSEGILCGWFSNYLGGIYFPQITANRYFCKCNKNITECQISKKTLSGCTYLYLSYHRSVRVCGSTLVPGPHRVAMMLVPTPHSSGKEADINVEEAINHKRTVS